MRIYSDRDIKREVTIDPPTQIGAVSVDLELEKVYELEEPKTFPYESQPTYSPRLEWGLLSNCGWFREKPPEEINGELSWVLKKRKQYLIEYAQRIYPNHNSLPAMQLTRRSGYARCGLFYDRWYFSNGVVQEMVEPIVTNRLYKGDRISQLYFFSDEPDSNVPTGIRIIEGKDVRNLTLESPSTALHIAPKGLVFRGEMIDRKKFKPEEFEEIELFADKVSPDSLILARTREVVRIPRNYVGRLGNYVYVEEPSAFVVENARNFTFLPPHCSSPYSHPGSFNSLVLEIVSFGDTYNVVADTFRKFSRNRKTRLSELVQKNVIIPMTFIRVKTPPNEVYNGRFSNQRDILLPF